jgi:hypothetical protein
MVNACLKRDPHIHMQFTLASASCLNMVARFFRDWTDKGVRLRAFPSVFGFKRGIDPSIKTHHENPVLFTWTAKASSILEKAKRTSALQNHLQSS